MIGLTLQPDPAYLELLGRALREEVDYFEVAPETTWRVSRGALVPNGYHRAFLALGAETEKPFVAHGVGLSPGGATRKDAARRRRWLSRLAEDQRAFGYRWYTEHAGTTTLDGLELMLPLPVPHTRAMVARHAAALAAMRRVVPVAGLENSVFHFTHEAPEDEPRFLNHVLHAAGAHLLLDLHNLFVHAVNFGLDPAEWLREIDLGRVIEIHLSGGSDAAPEWGVRARLDSHDSAVPEEVWRLFERVAPRCPNLRGVTLERMEGTVAQDDVPRIVAELRRARAILRAARATAAPAPARRAPRSKLSTRRFDEARLARAIVTGDTDDEGLRLTSLLVARLRFERLIRGSAELEAWFDADPERFTATFRRYHREVPPTAYFPSEEAALWASRAIAGTGSVASTANGSEAPG